MGTLGLLQIVFDIFVGVGLFILTMRFLRQPKDDPRLSRGLQLLQAKIAVLEDLSDRTESQVQQMTSMLDQKCREVQAKIQLADRHVELIRSSMERSLDVAKIFQDKIPHQEIIERKNTLKYLQAARMAHQGRTVEEIMQAVQLPKGEIEFIAKVNRDQLTFSEDQLPAWARMGDPAYDLGGEADAVDFTSPSSAAVSETSAFGARAGAPAGSAAGPAAELVAEAANAMPSSLHNEHQELLENLQRVQREMDEMLQSELPRRDLSDVFTPPRPPTEELSRLGEEFRKACEPLHEKLPGHVKGAGIGALFAASAAPLAAMQPQSRPARESTEREDSALSGAGGDGGPLLDLTLADIEALKTSLTASANAKTAAANGATQATAAMASSASVPAMPPSAPVYPVEMERRQSAVNEAALPPQVQSEARPPQRARPQSQQQPAPGQLPQQKQPPPQQPQTQTQTQLQTRLGMSETAPAAKPRVIQKGKAIAEVGADTVVKTVQFPRIQMPPR